ncbi:unnamed protein product [Cladocopium goreaui]|uniref:Uncharacterized protein n=1 Tax=Cladocopium goreaui TaxID=2562237 RepID=A0A9P1C2Z6_9DINO|nr:unnamed protein product [Cladocopium goreaui]
MAFRVSTLHTASGQDVCLEPALAPDEALEDLRRRAAYALRVGIRQVTLLNGDKELVGNCSVADVIDESTVQDLTVLLQPVLRVYRPQLKEAWKATGFVKLQKVAFPPSSGIDVNMMPFRMGDKASLPKQLKGYWPLIEACRLPQEEIGKVGFLTIQETDVTAGDAQRRPGLHLETPGVVMLDGRVLLTTARWGWGLAGFKRKEAKKVPPMHLLEDDSKTDDDFDPFEEDDQSDEILDGLDGDIKFVHTRLQGGIYTASTVENSARYWDLRFSDPAEVCGPLGDLEHMRQVLGSGEAAEAETLYWMSDATPHESVPLKEDSHRQYFRLVTSSVSLWYSKHSTENPLVKPDPSVTRIVDTDKFEDFPLVGRFERRGSDAGDKIWDVYAEHLGEGGERKLLEQQLGPL